jgi:hypothetical protein
LRLAPNHPVVPLASITLRPRHGVRVMLESREKKEAVSSSSGRQAAVAD